MIEFTSFIVDIILETRNPDALKDATLTKAILLGPDVGVEEMTLKSPMLSLVIVVGVTPISIFWLIPTLLKILGLFRPSEFKFSLNLNATHLFHPSYVPSSWCTNYL